MKSFFTCLWKLRSLEIYWISQQGADLIERLVLAFQSSSSNSRLETQEELSWYFSAWIWRQEVHVPDWRPPELKNSLIIRRSVFLSYLGLKQIGQAPPTWWKTVLLPASSLGSGEAHVTTAARAFLQRQWGWATPQLQCAGSRCSSSSCGARTSGHVDFSSWGTWAH